MSVILAVQKLEIRRGDDLPGFAAIVEDGSGNPVDLTDKTAYIRVTFVGGEDEYLRQVHIIDAPGGVVQHDWQSADTQLFPIGVHDLVVLVVDPDRPLLTAPSDRTVQLSVRSEAVRSRTFSDAILTCDGRVLRTCDDEQLFTMIGRIDGTTIPAPD